MNKGYLITAAILCFCMVVFPLCATGEKNVNKAEKATVLSSTSKAESSDKKITLKRVKSGKIVTLDALEYTIGVTAAEMDADYEPEALKAQAVAAYTLCLWRKGENTAKNYDITDDSSIDQSYIDDGERREKWGKNYDKYEKKIESAVLAVLYKKITYNNKVILSVYFDTSGGKTESAENIWGKDYTYLVPVESVGDLLSESYLSTVTYTPDEFKSMAASLKIDLSGDSKNWLSEAKCSDSGTVLLQKIGTKTVSGVKIRSAFSLHSANFDIKYENGKFIFTVRGYGHGVGMSQYGANYLAKRGSSYIDILKWYYTNVEISG